jgi:hypothetical protein
MPEPRRFSQLSPARQALVRFLQSVNFGELQGIQVEDADPIFDGTSVVILDVKLDKEELPRPELDLADFALSAEVLRLMSRLDELKNGTIQHLEVRAGIPRRLLLASRLIEPPSPASSNLVDQAASRIAGMGYRSGPRAYD